MYNISLLSPYIAPKTDASSKRPQFSMLHCVPSSYDLHTKKNNEAIINNARASFINVLGQKEYNDIARILKYIGSNPNFPNCEVNIKDITDFIQTAKTDCNFDPSVNLETTKEGIDKLSRFLDNPLNQKFFPKISEECFTEILTTNSNFADSFLPDNAAYMGRLFSDEAFQPIFNTLNGKDIIEILRDKNFDKELMSRNLTILKDGLTAGWLKFGRENIPFNINLLSYKGNLAELLHNLQTKCSQLPDDKIFNYHINSQTGETVFRYTDKSYKTENFQIYNVDFEPIGCMNTEKNGPVKNVIIKDLVRNTDYVIKKLFDEQNQEWVVVYQMKEVKDELNQLKSREFMMLSNVEGVYNIKEMDEEGQLHTLCKARKDSDGTHIEKKLRSFDGTQTAVKYYASPNNRDEFFEYKIIDTRGNVLAKKETAIKVLDENTVETNTNGKKYIVSNTPEGIVISNFETGEAELFSNKKLQTQDKNSLINLLMQLTGEELIKLNNTVSRIIPVSQSVLSAFTPLEKTLYVGPDRFVTYHECGHAKDLLDESAIESWINKQVDTDTLKYKIAQDPEFLNIYESEKRAFVENYPSVIQDELRYFIDEKEHYLNKQGPVRETIADANGITNSPVFFAPLMYRSHYLQQYFPRTIAYLMNNKL